MHRFGTERSPGIDNASSVGISAGIDPETGELDEVMIPPEGGAAEPTWRETHPDTGVQIAGREVPEWDHITDRLLDVASEYNWLWPYVGWDVILLDDDGSMKLLEGNRNCGTKFIQAHHPLLADERVRRFYDHYGIC